MEAVGVLVVEDEAMIVDLVHDVLTDAGFDVTIAVNGAQAISALEQAHASFRAVVTDIRLDRGGRTGWDVARSAREFSPSIAVVYMSGDAAADWSAQGVPNSVMLPKPFAPAQVVTAVAQLINAADPPTT